MRILPYRVLILCLLLALSAPALASTTIGIAPAGDGTFVLSGSGLDDVAAIDVTVSYDTATLANPQVSQGSLLNGAVMAANTGIAGRIRLAAVSARALGGSGTVATFGFKRVGESAGVITSLDGRLTGVNGGTVPARFTVINPPQPDPADEGEKTASTGRDQGDATSAPSSAPAAAVSAGRQMFGGTLTMPAGTEGAGESKARPESPEEPHEKGTPETGGAPSELRTEGPRAGSPKPAEKPAEPVLERFRLFKGVRSVENLTALFDPGRNAAFRQEEPVVIADGSRTVRVAVFNLGDGTPRFLFSHGVFVSCAKRGDGAWEVEMRPEPGALAAGVTVLADGLHEEIPLAVAPRGADIKGAGGFTEAGFALFLKGRGTAGAPRFDLNGDGKRDYVDDYIFTANYLAEREKSGKPAAARKAPERPGAAGAPQAAPPG